LIHHSLLLSRNDPADTLIGAPDRTDPVAVSINENAKKSKFFSASGRGKSTKIRPGRVAAYAATYDL
jgi:hypothetical protein